MLAAMNGHKDVVLILTHKGANLDFLNNVSVHVHMLYQNGCITEEKMYFLFLLKGDINCYSVIIKVEPLFFYEYAKI